MINKLKVSIELILLVFVMTLIIIGLGIYGVLEIRQSVNSSKELYADRMLPMDQFGDIRFYASNIIAIANQVDNRQITCKEALQMVKQAQDSINVNWQNYKLSYLTDEEKKLVSETGFKIKKSDNAIEKFKELLKKEDCHAFDYSFKKKLYPSLNSIIVESSKLLRLQVEVANNITKSNYEVYNSYTQKISWILLIIFFCVFPFAYYVLRKNIAIIKSFNLIKENLSLSEEKCRSLIDFAGEAILILNEETEIIDLNEMATNLFGYTREEFLKMRISDLVSQEDIEKQKEDIDLIRRSKFEILNRRIRRKDGVFVETEISNRLMEGKGFFAIIHDITERKKAEEKIKKSEEKYRYLFNNNPVCIVIWDLETLEVLEINNIVLNKYGYSKEEWARMSVLDYCRQEEYNFIKDFAQNMLINDELVSEGTWSHYKKDGEEIIMEISSHKIKYDNRNAILSLGKDVTEQAKIESQLKEREAQLNLFIKHSPASLAMFDKEMRYIVTSNRWIEDYNLFEKDIVGKTHYEIFPEIGQEWKEIHQRCLRGAIEKREEDVFVRNDGRVDWVRWEIHPWYKISNKIGGIIMFTEVITERKKAAEMFKNQFENSPDIILYVNKYHIIEAINKVFSYSVPVNEIIGLNCIEVLPEESREIAKTALEKCFATRENQEIENTLRNACWVRSRFVPVITNDEVTHVMIIATDLSIQKQAELKLKQSEEKHRALTENISDAILLLNEEAKIVYQSPSAERMLGYSFEETCDRSFTDFLTSEEFSRAQLFFKEVIQTPNVAKQNQFMFIHKNGQKIWAEGTVLNLLENDSVKAIIVNCRDITKRKELEAQQALTASIVSSSDDAIISKTLDSIITSWNKGAEKLLGYSPEEVIGKNISMLIPDYLKDEEKMILDQISIGHSVDHFETVRQNKNGELIEVSLTISPIYDELGNNVIGASKIMRDITISKTFENELIRYNAELKKTNAELDRFVYSVSHDLRAPLKSMLGLINITLDDIKENETLENGLALEIVERLYLMDTSVIKLDNFIEDILNYSRNSRLELIYEEIDFEDLINEVRNYVKFIEEKQVDFSISINSQKQFISDRKRLMVILNNLISNAYKYSDFTKEESFINVTCSINTHNVIITIEDNGIGIVENDIKKIFDMFYRSSAMSTGSGLGLYIVKETVDKLGGKISVESEFGKNSKFCIEIPNQTNL